MKKKSFFLTAVATLSLATATIAQTIPNYVPTNGLVGWWPFNGNANDESGNNNNGTVNGATLTSDRFGNAGKAYSFDGVNDFIEVTNNSSLSVTVWSISAWVNPSGYYLGNVNGNVSDGNVVVGKGTDFNSGFYSLSYKSLSQKARGSFGIGNLPNFVDNTTSITSNQWRHILVSWDGVTMRIYTNGQLENTNSNITSVQGINNQNLFFGTMAANNLYPYWVNGIIDDIGIWNRALTQQEITDLYNANICYQTVTVTDTLIINTNLVGFNPITYQNTIKIFPNPTNDHITINYGNYATLNGYQLKIINSLGQQLFQTAINQQSSYINLSTWTGNGIYFVQIIDPQGNIIDIRKIVLQ